MNLMQKVLLDINEGKRLFGPTEKTESAIIKFQPFANRLLSALQHGYIRDAKHQDSLSRSTHGMITNVIVVGGLTFEGEKALLTLTRETKMDFDALAYPDIFEIDGKPYKGARNRAKSEIKIPYTDAPNVTLGSHVTQNSGPNTIYFKVLDVSYLEGGSLYVGTLHPHILTIFVENMTSAAHATPPQPTAFNIGSISAQQVQVGNQNTQVSNITLSEVVQRVASSEDNEAKNLLVKLLGNNTVSAIVGAGASALLGVLVK